MCGITEVIHLKVFNWNWAVARISMVSPCGLLSPSGLFRVFYNMAAGFYGNITRGQAPVC